MPELICGTDEAGRGPLAGPVCAAAVILDPRRMVAGLADSKMFSPKLRAKIAVDIRNKALAWGIGWASAREIDEINILKASLLAMRRAVESLKVIPTELLVDGLHCPQVSCRVRAIVDGDATVPAIAAASILAKTARDAEMLRLHTLYPEYGFDQHKGYPTPAHLRALASHGVLPDHRRSFAPVRRIIDGDTSG
jgi:ribonuclease HII